MPSPAVFSIHSNLSLFAVPAAYIVAFLPHTIKLGMVLANKGHKFDNKDPRGTMEVDAKTNPQAAKAIERLKWIHVNGLEIFPLFATAVIIGNFSRLPAKYLNSFAALFLSSRLVFSACYFYQESELAANTRTGAFFVGMLSSVTVLFTAASKVYKL